MLTDAGLLPDWSLPACIGITTDGRNSQHSVLPQVILERLKELDALET
jgi:hypothetical protein